MPGGVNSIDNFGMTAWACSPDRTKSSRIRVDVNGTPTYVFLPNEFNKGLAQSGWAGGRCNIVACFPKIIGLFESAVVEVWNEETGELLSKPGLTLSPATRNAGKYVFEVPRNIGSANPVQVSFEGDICVTRGQAVYDSQDEIEPELVFGDAAIISFTQNVNTTRPVSAMGLTFRGFVLRTRAKGDTPYSLFHVAPPSRRQIRPRFAGLVAALSPSTHAETPPYENMSRTSGKAITAELFAAGGLTTAAKLDGATNLFAGRPLSGFDTILDWGAGVGRVASNVIKYFAPNSEIWCADIDDVNITMAADFCDNARCSRLPYWPPADLPGDYFDLIYGISVFTHLTEAAQDLWLRELSRISRSGAILVMSANTEFAAAFLSEIDQSHMADLLAVGISDRVSDRNLGAKLERRNYYRVTYHLSDYIRDIWGKHFEIIEIVHRADVQVQDFVVMRKP